MPQRKTPRPGPRHLQCQRRVPTRTRSQGKEALSEVVLQVGEGILSLIAFCVLVVPSPHGLCQGQAGKLAAPFPNVVGLRDLRPAFQARFVLVPGPLRREHRPHDRPRLLPERVRLGVAPGARQHPGVNLAVRDDLLVLDVMLAHRALEAPPRDGHAVREPGRAHDPPGAALGELDAPPDVRVPSAQLPSLAPAQDEADPRLLDDQGALPLGRRPSVVALRRGAALDHGSDCDPRMLRPLDARP
mmetsp:Transcript_93873/g.265181  ORF Transcript_93873/g.265181 Transcript_93873/m.265181 type:complete len:244 (-) Transcript_93873:20-751(-)